MMIDEIAKLAAQNTLPESDLPLAEALLWYRLRDLYKTFATGSISKESAAAEKQRIVKQYNSDRATQGFYENYVARSAQMWQRIEAAATAYRNNKTIENADKFVEVVYGVKMKEE